MKLTNDEKDGIRIAFESILAQASYFYDKYLFYDNAVTTYLHAYPFLQKDYEGIINDA